MTDQEINVSETAIEGGKKIALFGGSFDPVQKAHMDIIKKLSKKFDKVIVVPSRVSPFKQNAEPESAEHRVQMLKIALDKLENVKVSRFEIKRESVSYSYMTALHYAEKYAGNELFFVIGSDLLNELHKWAEFDALKNLVTFYVFEREGYPIEEKTIKKLEKRGVKLKISKQKMPDISSSFARAAAAFNSDEAVGKKILKYIKENRLYTDYDEIIRSYDVFNMIKERREHTCRTIKAGVRLAKRFGADVNKTIFALLLHDIGKYATDELLSAYNIKLDKKIELLPKDIKHSTVSALIAKNYLNITDSQILAAIKTHTTGKKGMNKLSKVVYLADYAEEGRSHDGVQRVRELCNISLDLAMRAALENTVENLRSEGKDIYPLTLEALEYFSPKKNTQTQAVTKNKKETSVKETVLKPEKKQKAVKAEARPAAHKPEKSGTDEPYDLAYTIAQLISDKKGRDIVLIDLRGKTIIADYFVIASVTSTTAVKAITDYVDEKLSKDYSIEPLRRDIDPKWAAVDYGSVILHIQLDETRKFYDIERLWSDGTNVNIFDK